MKSKKNLLLVIFLIIIVAIIIYTGYQLLYKNKQEATLSSSCSTIASMNLLNENIEHKTQTIGKYAKVENAIINCVKDFSNLCIEISHFSLQNELSDLLNNEPQPANSETNNINEYLTDAKTKVNDKITQLNIKSSEDFITSYISKENLSNYYNNLYKKSILDNSQINTNMNKIKLELTNMLNSVQDIFNYLIDNQSKWSIQNQMLYFEDNPSLVEYNKLISDLKNKTTIIDNLSTNLENDNPYLSLDEISK